MMIFQNLIEAKREKYRATVRQMTKSEFRVAERDGSLWITHKGIAVIKLSEYASAKEIAEKLDECRNTALEYDRL